MKFSRFVTAAVLMFAAIPLFADSMVEVDLPPIDHRQASLTIMDVNGVETTYTPEMIEEFATYSLTTTTPWRDEPANFEGALLSDILKAHGLDTVASILVTAENDYSTTMSQALLETVDVLVATRVDGRPHTRRERGPIQFVIGSEAFSSSDLTTESNFVWMAARIEAEG